MSKNEKLKVRKKLIKKLPDIYNIRRALEDCIEEKLKGNVTDCGTWLDFSGADVAFELKGKRYNIEINDITKESKWLKEYMSINTI